MGWVESLNLTARDPARGGNTALPALDDLAPDYLSFWLWFDQITGRRSASGKPAGEMSPGSQFTAAADLVLHYGVMRADAWAARRSGLAERAIATELAPGGRLQTYAWRQSHPYDVFDVLATHVWALEPHTRAHLESTFFDAAKGLRDFVSTPGLTSSGAVVPAQRVPIRMRHPLSASRQYVDTTLAHAIDAADLDPTVPMADALLWRQLPFGAQGPARVLSERSLIKALLDEQPAVVSVLVDFNSFGPGGEVRQPANPPGRQGMHLMVLQDFGAVGPCNETWPLGTVAPESEKIKIENGGFLEVVRAKNSWGCQSGLTNCGYNDFYMTYLLGTQATTLPGMPPTLQPLTHVVLPMGYRARTRTLP